MLKQSDQGLTKTKGTSGVDAALVLNTLVQEINQPHKLEWVGVKFSAAPVHAGILIEIISADGDAFNTLLLLGNANDENLFYQPDEDLNIQAGDVIRVTTPAGGVTITSTTTIQMREG